MAYLYRVEDSAGVGPFQSRHGLMTMPEDYQNKVMEHISHMENNGDVPSLLIDNDLSHANARFGCSTIEGLKEYLGPLVIQFCNENRFVLVRYELPDNCIYHGKYQSVIPINRVIDKEYLGKL